jgi:transcriptional regulator with XRE-family HTH domain
MSQVSITTQVADRIRSLRVERRWSARQLAEECSRAGMSSLTRSTIAKIESGVRKSMTVDELAVLSVALGVSRDLPGGRRLCGRRNMHVRANRHINLAASSRLEALRQHMEANRAQLLRQCDGTLAKDEIFGIRD